MPLVFDESRPQGPAYYIREMVTTTLALIPKATEKQKTKIKALEKAIISAVDFQGKQLKLAEEEKHHQTMIELQQKFSRETRKAMADMISEHENVKRNCQELTLQLQLLEWELSQEKNMDESSDQFDFDPEKPKHYSAYLKVMRQIFKSTSPEQFHNNKGKWHRLESAIIQATSNSAEACHKQFTMRADGYHVENEFLQEEIRKLNNYAGECIRWQNQAEFYKADSINLKEQLNEAKGKIELLEQEVRDGNEKALQALNTEKELEVKKLQQTIDRQKLMMEYKEQEQKAAKLYAELQITELQKELLRMRLRDDEK